MPARAYRRILDLTLAMLEAAGAHRTIVTYVAGDWSRQTELLAEAKCRWRDPVMQVRLPAAQPPGRHPASACHM